MVTALVTPITCAIEDERGTIVGCTRCSMPVAVRTAKGIEQRVHPTMVPKSSSIAQVMGVTNAVTIDGEGIPPITLVGPGAGGAATASAVVADIADVARGIRAKPFGRPVDKLRDTQKAPMERHEGGYYIRLMARDLAGTAADERPLRDRAVRIFDVELHRRVRIHDLEGIERPVDLRFLAQCVHAGQRMMRLQ